MINLKKDNFLLSVIFTLSAFLLSFQSVFADVDDPYAWLEKSDSAETIEWVAKQNKLTDSYFDDSSASSFTQAQIAEKLSEIANLDSIGIPLQRGDRLFYLMQKKGMDQKVLVVQESDGEITTLVDPNNIDSKGNISLTGFEVSKNGKYLSFGLSESGSDKGRWFFLDLESGEQLPDIIDDIKFSKPILSKDGQVAYYVRFIDGSHGVQGIYCHCLGQEPNEDRLIFQSTEFSGCLIGSMNLVFNNRFLLLSLRKGSDKNNGVFLLNVETKEISEVFPIGSALYDYVGQSEDRLYFMTSREAGRNRVIAVAPFSFKEIEEIIPEKEHLLNSAVMANNSIVCSYFDHCKSMIQIFDNKGQFKQIVALPHPGTAAIAGTETESFFFGFTSFAFPSSIYRHHIDKNATDVFFSPEISWNVDDYITHQFFIPSKDGTLIPLFITHKKGIALNGKTPTLMYGYGGFNLSITPSFSPLNLAWMDMGGIYVSVSLRGGGEYGAEWHYGGCLHNKQNVFDDFVAAGEWLIANNYTTARHLAITGRSNGGLLAAACLVQRPDLFAAVIPQVGVLDLLKFHKFTIGWAWMCDYGNPENPADYRYLLSYSPYHNIAKGRAYPATLITTADCDDRVVPMHSYKFAARLQELQGGENPILLRVYSNTGHGTGRSTSHLIREHTEILRFLYKELFKEHPLPKK